MSKGSTHSTKGARLSRRALTAAALASALLLPLISALAINLNTVETSVTQNFDTIGTSATATLPADFKADKQTTAQTVGSYATAVTATELRAGNGMSSTAQNGIYNFAAGDPTTATERAVGFISSGTATKSGNLYAKYTNTTGSTLSALRISYDVERYRNGTNAAGFRYQLFYSTDGTNWTSAGANFLTAFAANADSNGCTPAPCETKSVPNQFLSLTASPIANNADIYLAWNYSVATGTTTTNAQALGIDNISVTPIGGSIGATGVRTTDIQGTDDGGYAMALQPDGKIVVGGYAVNVSGNKDFALVRYNYDGSLDTTFNGTGKVVTDFNGTSDRVWGIALQSDGKIVAAGETVSAVFPGTNDIALARYNTNGTLDTTFNLTGKVTTDHGGGANNAAYAVAISGTNIIVAGYEAVSGNNDFMVARYTSGGLLDTTFGTLGVTTLGFSGFNDVARAVAIDGSSRIVVGGYASNGSDDDFAIARFTSGGVLDTSFVAGAGKAAINIFSPASADQAFGIAINPVTQSIVLAGSAYNNGTGNKDFALVRYFPTGALDGSFGSGGVVTTDFGNSADVANSVYVRNDGVTVAGGFSRFSTSSDDFALARYVQNGGPDTTFDGDGKLALRISNADERAYAVAPEFDGKIVAAGFATAAGSNPVQHDFALARFNPNGTLDSTNPTALNSPDLLVQIIGPDNPNSLVAGSPFQYSVLVTNRGGAPATNVVLTYTLSAGLTYDRAIVSHGDVSVNVAAGVVTNNIGTLNPGETASLDVDVIVGNTPRLVSTTAVATLNETDPTPSNNAVTEYTRIIGVSDLSFSPSTVFGGCQNSTGTVTLSGPAPSGGVFVHLSSAEPSAASAPAQVLVPGGQTSAQFTVTTSPVVTDRTVRFEVTLGPTSFVRRLVVNSGCF